MTASMTSRNAMTVTMQPTIWVSSPCSSIHQCNLHSVHAGRYSFMPARARSSSRTGDDGTGRSKQRHPARSPIVCSDEIARQIYPFVQGDTHRVVGIKRPDQAVAQRDIVTRIDETAEQAVKDDQQATIVAVQMLGIAGMVYLVVGRRVEQPLDRCPQLRYPRR